MAAGAGGILFLHFYFGVNINAAITLCMPVIGIIGLCGFYQKNDMTLPEIVRSVIRLVRQKPFTYETGIFRNEMEDCNNAENKKGKHQNTGV